MKVRVLAAALALVAVAACKPLPIGSAPPSDADFSTVPASAAPSSAAPPSAPTLSIAPHGTPSSSALMLLATLVVKGRAPMTGYSRDQFGPAWPKVDGCDARNEVLLRDLTKTVRRDDCVVLSGTLVSPYTGGTINFVRGPRSAEVQIDHVVALGDAWQTGAQQWSKAQREKFANDPRELLAVDARSNEQKGDADAASWLPSNKGFRCAYVAIQVTVKAQYRLWVTPAEHDAMARVLATCGA